MTRTVDLTHSGNCAACGYLTRLHYDDENRMVGCAGATRLYAVDRGRLLQLKLQRNEAARIEALGSIRLTPLGKWQVKIGGRRHGAWQTWTTRRLAEQHVESYYNEQALRVTLNPQEVAHGDTPRGVEAERPE